MCRAAVVYRGLVVVFAVDGALFASWASRLPQIQDDVGANHATLGLALAGTAVGALSAIVAAGIACRRRPPYPIGVLTVSVMCLALLVPGIVDTPIELGIGLMLFGACYGATDVAMNSAAVQLVAVLDRPILPRLHGAYSAGAVGGAALGAGAAAIGMSVLVHFALVGAIALAVLAVISWGPVVAGGLPPTEPALRAHSATRNATRHRTWTVLSLAAALTASTAFAGGVAASWSGIHLVDDAGAALWVAPLGYALMSLSMAIMRGFGTHLLERFGARLVACVGALVAAAAWFVVLIPDEPIVLAGYLIAGIGMSCLFPIGVAYAGAAGGSVGVSVLSGVGYSAFLIGPPVVGIIGHHFGLTTAFAGVAVALLVVAVTTSQLPKDPRLLGVGPSNERNERAD